MNQFSRTALLIGEQSLDRLAASKVAIFGVGGVGSFAAEAIARAGVGNLTLVDSDRVDLTNINRQLYALLSTVGEYKVDVAKRRILDINPDAIVNAVPGFYSAENASNYNLADFDYIVDAIDTVTSKLCLIENAAQAGVKIISSMGAGNKLDPTRFEVAYIYKTEVCPLARVMRRELKKRGIERLKVVYSKEKPIKPINLPNETTQDHDDRVPIRSEASADMKGSSDRTIRKSQAPGSISFVPSAAGLIIAGEVVKDLIKYER